MTKIPLDETLKRPQCPFVFASSQFSCFFQCKTRFEAPPIDFPDKYLVFFFLVSPFLNLFVLLLMVSLFLCWLAPFFQVNQLGETSTTKRSAYYPDFSSPTHVVDSFCLPCFHSVANRISNVKFSFLFLQEYILNSRGLKLFTSNGLQREKWRQWSSCAMAMERSITMNS